MNLPSLWLLLAFTLYGLLHSALASLRVKALAERWLGEGVRRWYRLFFNVVAAITFLPIPVLVLLLPDAPLYVIPQPWIFLTVVFQLTAAFGLVLGVMQTGGANFLGLEQAFRPASTHVPRRMVTGGLYRWVRHPLYSCGLVFLWLAPVMTWNTLFFNLGATAYLTIGTLFEERKLLIEFGEPYAAYRRDTPMLIPGLRLRRR